MMKILLLISLVIYTAKCQIINHQIIEETINKITAGERQGPRDLRNFRTIGSSVNSLIESNDPYPILAEYGCWCNFATGNYGHGIPVDYIDTLCKQLWDNYKCTVDRSTSLGETCSFDTEYSTSDVLTNSLALAIKQKYISEIGAQSSLEMAFNECENSNADSLCKQELCKAKTKFTFDFLPDGVSKSNNMASLRLRVIQTIDRKYSEEFIGENFDRDLQCTAQTALNSDALRLMADNPIMSTNSLPTNFFTNNFANNLNNLDSDNTNFGNFLTNSGTTVDAPEPIRISEDNVITSSNVAVSAPAVVPAIVDSNTVEVPSGPMCCGESPSYKIFDSSKSGCCGTTVYSLLVGNCNDDVITSLFV